MCNKTDRFERTAGAEPLRLSSAPLWDDLMCFSPRWRRKHALKGMFWGARRATVTCDQMGTAVRLWGVCARFVSIRSQGWWWQVLAISSHRCIHQICSSPPASITQLRLQAKEAVPIGKMYVLTLGFTQSSSRGWRLSYYFPFQKILLLLSFHNSPRTYFFFHFLRVRMNSIKFSIYIKKIQHPRHLPCLTCCIVKIHKQEGTEKSKPFPILGVSPGVKSTDCLALWLS